MNCSKTKMFLMMSCGFVCGFPVWAAAQDTSTAVLNALDSLESSSSATETPSAVQPIEDSGSKPAKSLTIDTLEFNDTDITQALKVISQKTGLNIMVAENVQGKVTIYLKDVDARDALKMILGSKGLAFIEEGGIFRVMTAGDFQAEYGYPFGEQMESKVIHLTNAQPSGLLALLNQMKTASGRIIADDKAKSLIIKDITFKVREMEDFLKGVDVPLETEIFALNYVTAEDMKAKLMETLTPGLGHIASDVRSNKIVVTDTSEKIAEINKIIKAFDEKEKELVIEAKIVQITLNDEHKDGVDWAAIVSDYHRLNFLVQTSNKNKEEKDLSVGTVSGDDYEILLEALDTVGKMEVVSNPHLLTINNKEEKLLIDISSGSEMSLYLKPTIHNNNDITLKIAPAAESPGLKIPVPQTTLTVKDKTTIVIGGLTKEERIPSVKKIPLLGDLPILGFAFRNEHEQIRKSEIVVFLTPKIANGDSATEKGTEDSPVRK